MATWLRRQFHKMLWHKGNVDEPGTYVCPKCGEEFYDDGEYGR